MNEQISEEERARQQALSQREPTLEERGNVGGVAVDVAVGEIATEFADEVVEPVAEVEPAYRVALPSANEVIATFAASHNSNMVRLNVQGKLNFVLDLSADEVAEVLEDNGNIEIAGVDYNVVQPLNKYNASSGRIGLLTTRVRELAKNVAAFEDLSSSVMLPADFADSSLHEILEARASVVTSAMFDGFEAIVDNADDGSVIHEPVLTFDSGITIPVSDVFGATFRTKYEVDATDVVTTITATIETYVRLRVPVLLRPDSAKVESTLIRYAQHLQKVATKESINSEVFVAFRSADLFKEPVWNILSIIRDNFEAAELCNEVGFQEAEANDTVVEGEPNTVFGKCDVLINLTHELLRRADAE